MKLQVVITAITRLSLALSVIFLNSCNKDQTNSVGVSDPESRITKAVFDSQYVSIGFTTLNYADEKLVNIHMFDSIHNLYYDYDISYPAENQVKVTHRSNANRYTLFSYNSNSKLTKIEESSNQGGKFSYTLHSSNNKLDYVTGSDPLKPLWKYKYDGNGNIVQLVRPENQNWQKDTVNFKYDNQSNLYQNNQLYFLIEYSINGFNQEEMSELGLPMLFSKNNLTSSEWKNNNRRILNYETDNKGRLTKLFYDQTDQYRTKYYY